MALQASRVLITGGAGFIGSHLVARCLERGHVVHIVARPSSCTARLEALAGRLELHRLQFDDRAALGRCLSRARPDRIFHLATRSRWQASLEFEDVFDGIDQDLRGLVTLLATAASSWPPKAFVRAGTLAEYGDGATPCIEMQREVASSNYGTVMAAGTHFAQMLQPRLAFPVVTARLALVYGPAQSNRFLLPLLIERCLAGEPSVVRNPDDRRDLLHVDDAVDALCRLAARPEPGAVVNIATGSAPTMRDVARLVLRATRADPVLIAFGCGKPTPTVWGSPALARARFDWQARVPLAVGIERTVEWFRAQQAPKEVSLC